MPKTVLFKFGKRCKTFENYGFKLAILGVGLFGLKKVGRFYYHSNEPLIYPYYTPFEGR